MGFEDIAAAVSQIVQGVFATIRFAFEFAGSSKSLAVLLVVFIICAFGVWMYSTGDPRFVAFFGGTVSEESTNNWENLAAPEAINRIRFAQLHENSDYVMAGYALALHGGKETCTDHPLTLLGLGNSSQVLWRGLFTDPDDNEYTDCGYTIGSVGSATGDNYTAKVQSISGNTISLCADDRVMLNQQAPYEWLKLQGQATLFSFPGFNLNGYMVDYSMISGTSACSVLFNGNTGERIYCSEAEQVFKTNLNCTTTTKPVLGAHNGVHTTTGILGVFGDLDSAFQVGFGLLDNVGLLQLATGGKFNFKMLYLSVKYLFMLMFWLAAILFILACVWAVYASHRTF